MYSKVSETKNKVPSLSRICGRFSPTIFRPKADPLPVKLEGVTPERTLALEGISPLCSLTTVWEPTAGKCNIIIK